VPPRLYGRIVVDPHERYLRSPRRYLRTAVEKLDNRLTAVESKVDGINRGLDTEAMARQDEKLPERVAAIEQHPGLNQKAAV
jgi:hypothetical protein